MSPWQDLLDSLDQQIRGGQDSLAKEQLLKIKVPEIPREYRAPFADLARRVTLPALSIQFIQPVVRPKIPIHPPPTVKEWAVYGAALTRVGALHEALQILEKLETGANPEVLLYQVFAHFSQWEYLKPIALLKKYLDHPSLTDYQRLVGKLNLAAAYVFEQRTSLAEPLLRELILTAQTQSLDLIQGNAHELTAQLLINTKDYGLAEVHLKKASGSLAKTKSNYEFFARKWQSIVNVLKNNGSPESIVDLLKIQAEAKTRREWESARACDLYHAIATNNEPLMNRLYFGTPFIGYRRAMRKHFQVSWSMPNEYVWTADNNSSENTFSLIKSESLGLKSSQSLWRFVQILASDFYRPLSSGYIASRLYPGDYFDPISTPVRLADVVKRIRAVLKEKNAPFQVHLIEKEYQIKITENCGLIIPLEWEADDWYESSLLELKKKWPYQSFSVSEARVAMGNSCQRLLKWATNEKKIYVSGRGPATRYRFRK